MAHYLFAAGAARAIEPSKSMYNEGLARHGWWIGGEEVGTAKRVFDWWDEHAKARYIITIGMIAMLVWFLVVIIEATLNTFVKDPNDSSLGALYFLMALTLSLLLFFSSQLIQMILSRADKKEIVKKIGDGNEAIIKKIGDGNEAIIKKIGDGNEAIIKKIGDGNEAIIAKMDELIDVIKKKP